MEPQVESRVVHGHLRSYVRAGSGPPILLIHGIGDSNRTWTEVVPLLARTHTVIAPDLLGHGLSDKPRADYSIGGFANGMRDLMTLLGYERFTLVGHSLGGGVAMQFAYQYPERVERLVLVSSGGLGAEVSSLLRLAALPGAELGIAASLTRPVRRTLQLLAKGATKVGLLTSFDVNEIFEVWSGLRDPSTRAAFLRTLRGVIDWKGQAVTGRDRLYLAEGMPALLVWGDRDPIVPVTHAAKLAEVWPGARIEVMRRSGHVPHRSHPERFAKLVTDFIATTPAAQYDAKRWRRLLAADIVAPVEETGA